MLIFAIDTSLEFSSVAVLNDNFLLAQSVVRLNRTHSQKIMSQINEIMSYGDITIKEMDVFSVAIGPGSFTGIRIGVAIAKAFAQAFQKSCVAVSTLESLANNVYSDDFICPIIDARRDHVYTALFKKSGQLVLRIEDDQIITIDAALRALKDRGKRVVFCGNGTHLHQKIITDKLGHLASFAPIHLTGNLAASVANIALNLALKGHTINYEQLKPMYIKKPQVEENCQ